MANEKTDIETYTEEERRLSATIADLKKETTLDTLHNDEAVKVLAAYGGDETWSAAEEKKVVRHIDRRLMPILILTYGLQYYDKAMLSQAVRSSSTSSPFASSTCPSRQKLSCNRRSIRSRTAAVSWLFHVHNEAAFNSNSPKPTTHALPAP